MIFRGAHRIRKASWFCAKAKCFPPMKMSVDIGEDGLTCVYGRSETKQGVLRRKEEQRDQPARLSRKDDKKQAMQLGFA